VTFAGRSDRFYRAFEIGAQRRVPFRVCIATTDLYLRADRDLSAEAFAAARRARRQIEAHIVRRPAFATSLEPLEPPGEPIAPILASMYAAGRAAGVGPMAAVAGAVAEAVGRELRGHSREVMVENGGDVYLDLEEEAVVGLLTGPSPFGEKLGMRVAPNSTPLGVCTSSATVGPSRSFGRADAATAVSRDTALADAVATRLGNRFRGTDDLESHIDWAVAISGVLGAVVVIGDRLAAAGDVELVETSCPEPAHSPPR
jgi:ApbE superfamily uncharacterized protein (UPF0280 family)